MIEGIFGLVGAIIGGVIAVAGNYFLLSIDRKRDASYSAIRVICSLEEYADKCLDVVHNDGTIDGQLAGRTSDGEEYRVAKVDAPGPIEYDVDIVWRSIDFGLMHTALALPNKARNTDRIISAAAEHSFQPYYEEVFDARTEGYARLGLDALNLASDLRDKFGIVAKSRAEINGSWNPSSDLRKKIMKIEEGRMMRERR